MNRLDLLIYAHDGRGLGHASRSVAIGLAVRRLVPQLRVLFVTGMKQSAGLIGEGPLDWVKLPSYETQVVNGVSRGCRGDSNLSDQELGVIRSGMLRDLVVGLNPRCILSDHMPQGKHRELMLALEAAAAKRHPHWILGMRGVVGDVQGVWSDAAIDVFRKFYKDILWYGDRSVLGEDLPDRIAKYFGRPPIVTGYVSRLAEWCHLKPHAPSVRPSLAGTVSIPWIGEHSVSFLEALVMAIERIGPSAGDWHFYLGRSRESLSMQKIEEGLLRLPFCRRFKPGEGYLHSLIQSRMAVIYGGYNSLTDLLYLKLPGLVVLREMRDQEQQAHLGCLRTFVPDQLQTVNEKEGRPDTLEILLRRQLLATREAHPVIRLDGAETAAHHIGQIVEDHRRRFS
jgi:predicted glycosyltransferase